MLVKQRVNLYLTIKSERGGENVHVYSDISYYEYDKINDMFEEIFKEAAKAYNEVNK